MKNKKSQTKINLWDAVGKIALMCLWVVVSIIAVQYTLGMIMVLLLGQDVLIQPVWTAVYSALSYAIAMALIILVPPKFMAVWQHNKQGAPKKQSKKGTLRESLGLTSLPTWTDIGLGPVGFIVTLLLAEGLLFLFSFFPWFNAEEVQNVGFSVYMGSLDRIIAFLTLVVVAPVAEEIIFRGWLYGKIRTLLHGRLSERWGMVISILIVSLLFGIVHMQWNVGVTVFAMSVVLCAFREITGTIYAGVLTHMIKNGVAFYLLYVLGVG